MKWFSCFSGIFALVWGPPFAQADAIEKNVSLAQTGSVYILQAEASGQEIDVTVIFTGKRAALALVPLRGTASGFTAEGPSPLSLRGPLEAGSYSIFLIATDGPLTGTLQIRGAGSLREISGTAHKTEPPLPTPVAGKAFGPRLLETPGAAKSLALSPDSRLLAILSETPSQVSLTILDAGSDRPITTIALPPSASGYAGPAFRRKENLVAVASSHALLFFEAQSGKRHTRQGIFSPSDGSNGLNAPPTALAVTPDGESAFLLGAGKDKARLAFGRAPTSIVVLVAPALEAAAGLGDAAGWKPLAGRGSLALAPDAKSLWILTEKGLWRNEPSENLALNLTRAYPFPPGAGPPLQAVATNLGAWVLFDSALWFQQGDGPGKQVALAGLSKSSALAATPDGRTLLVGGSEGLLLSEDAGTTWKLLGQITLPGRVLQLTLSQDGSTAYCLTETPDGAKVYAIPLS